jgi:hypothetical protein
VNSRERTQSDSSKLLGFGYRDGVEARWMFTNEKNIVNAPNDTANDPNSNRTEWENNRTMPAAASVMPPKKNPLLSAGLRDPPRILTGRS